MSRGTGHSFAVSTAFRPICVAALRAAVEPAGVEVLDASGDRVTLRAQQGWPSDYESEDGETLVDFNIADALTPCLRPDEGVVLTEGWSEASDCGVMIVAIKNGRHATLREAEIGASLLATL